LTLIRGEIWLDAWALDDGSLGQGEIGGELLAGIQLRDCPGFDLWLLMERSRCSMRSREELRRCALNRLASGEASLAAGAAASAVRLDPLDESAQELFLRTLMAAGREGVAQAHLASCEGLFAREGIVVSPALRAAAQDRKSWPLTGLRAGVVAASLLQAGTAAIDAGAADGGVETLRRAAEDAERAADPALRATVLTALGSALVHAVRGRDGEGAVVLHRALRAARSAGRSALAAEALRELAFVDVQAGRHSSAAAALRDAALEAAPLNDRALTAGLLAIDGMNHADRGRHLAAVALLTESAAAAELAGRPRQQAWSLGLLARSLLLAGRTDEARLAAEASMAGVREQRWSAFLPWPQAIRAECLVRSGNLDQANADAEQSFALGCELGDPCWEGMAARMLGMLALANGDAAGAWRWMLDARKRCDRVPDRYVWVSCYIGLAQLDVANRLDPALVPSLARQLREDATRADLPEFVAWALAHQSASGDLSALALAEATARAVDNPALHARLSSLREAVSLKKGTPPDNPVSNHD
jgi:tetratricopeptide (TPR) repeat protein